MHNLAQYCPGSSPAASTTVPLADTIISHNLQRGHVGWVAKRFYRLTRAMWIEVRFYRWLSSRLFLGPTAYSVLQSMALWTFYLKGFRNMNQQS
jgi:hypothetical protein